MGKDWKVFVKGLMGKIPVYLESAYLAQVFHFPPGQLRALPFCRSECWSQPEEWLEAEGEAGSLLVTVAQIPVARLETTKT